MFFKSWNPSTKPVSSTQKKHLPPQPQVLPPEILQLSCLIASCFSFPYLGQLGWTPPDPESPKVVPRRWLHHEKDVTIFYESSWVSSQPKTSHKGKYESDKSLHPGHHLSSAFSMIPEKVLHSKKTSSRIFLGAKFLWAEMWRRREHPCLSRGGVLLHVMPVDSHEVGNSVPRLGNI